MARRREGSSMGGFGGARQPGLAEYDLEEVGLAQYASQTGFAASLRRLEAKERDDEARRQKPSKSFPKKIDKENARRPHEHREARPPLEESKRRTDMGIQIGRRINFQGKGAEWRQFPEKLRRATGGYVHVVPHTEYAVTYLDKSETASIVDKKLANKRFGSEGREVAAIRDLIEGINVLIGREVAVDTEFERELAEEDMTLAQRALERRLDPDNPRWFEFDLNTEPTASDPEPQLRRSLWLPASFEVAAEPGVGAPHEVTLPLIDTQGVHERTRDRVIDLLVGDFGLDTSAVSDSFDPHVTILETTGRRNASQLSGLRVPSYPIQMELKSPAAYEA